MLEKAHRWSGMVLIAGAVVLALAFISISLQPVDNPILTPASSLLLLLAAFLLLISLPGVYLKQADASGGLGLVGHLLLQAGLLVLVIVAAPALSYPELKLTASENPTSFLLGIAMFAGLLLTGIATTRAAVFPRWQGTLLLVGAVGFLFSFIVAELLPPLLGQLAVAVPGILLMAALAAMGLFIWNSKIFTKT